jgi:hypothetical protein
VLSLQFDRRPEQSHNAHSARTFGPALTRPGGCAPPGAPATLLDSKLQIVRTEQERFTLLARSNW